jgi:hypothetical protein
MPSTLVRTSAGHVTIPASFLWELLKKNDENVKQMSDEMGIPTSISFELNSLHLYFDKPVVNGTRFVL